MGLDNRQPPSSVMPQCLRRTPKGISGPADNEEPSASKKRRLKKKGATKLKVTNKKPQQAWSIPEGKAYDDYFSVAGGGVS